jgi:hypothetical protein
MFQTLSPRAGDAIHPVLLVRVWLVRLGHKKGVGQGQWSHHLFNVAIGTLMQCKKRGDVK